VTVLAEQRTGYGPPAPVEIFQWAAEFAQLLDLYRERAPERVLEVGTYHGGTLYHWLTNARPGATVVTLDSYAVGVDNRHLYDGWCPPDVTVIALEGDSNQLATAERVGQYAPFGWVWIDAGHRYDQVKRDWDLYGPMCEPGGIVAFHDILPASRAHPEIEVSRLWQEIWAVGYETSEIIADPNASWGGIGLVHL
jgi:predicted O-methyltransferase YrrM